MPDLSSQDQIQLTKECIENFLGSLTEKGRGSNSLSTYNYVLQGLYDYLPEDKLITADTGHQWQEWMESQGFSARTINARLSVLNSLLAYLGRREWQMENFYRESGEAQPELTRAEYLRMLSTAKRTNREKSYMLIKTLGGVGLRSQELSQLTVDAVKQGVVKLDRHNGTRTRVLHIPRVLQQELLGYIRSEGIEEGPVFLMADGTPMSRTSVHRCVNVVGRDAHVDPEKANPRGLWRMYMNTCDRIRISVNLLIEQTYERMLEDEQLTIGWEIEG